MNTLEKPELTVSVSYIDIFSKLGTLIYKSEVPNLAGRKREEEEEHRQLQSVMHFTQTQKYIYITIVTFHKRKYSKLPANSWLISGKSKHFKHFILVSLNIFGIISQFCLNFMLINLF